MKRSVIALIVVSLPMVAFAADELNGSVWKTVDDKTNQPKALVKFKENGDGTLSGTIQKVLAPDAKQKCTDCEGKFKNKPLVGATIVTGLKTSQIINMPMVLLSIPKVAKRTSSRPIFLTMGRL